MKRRGALVAILVLISTLLVVPQLLLAGSQPISQANGPALSPIDPLGAASQSTAALTAKATWVNFTSKLGPAPSPRYDPAMVFDGTDGYTLLFGGFRILNAFGAWGCLGDTWILRNGTWSQLHPALAPSSRGGMSMVYDSLRREVVAFSGGTCGTGGSGYSNQTWLFSHGNWTLLRSAAGHAPFGRGFPGFAFDAATGLSVLFGGAVPDRNGAGTHILGDTWTFNGSSWQRVNTSSGAQPVPRWQAVMAYDPSSRAVILFSGLSPSDVLAADTWAFSNGSWSRLAPKSSPPGLEDGSMDWDGSLRLLILVEGHTGLGSGNLNGTWAFNGSDWHRTSIIPPPARRNAAMAFDTVTGRLVLFGGILRFQGSFPVTTNETWELT